MNKISPQFNSLGEIEPPSYLKGAILRRIAEARLVRTRNQKIFFAASFSLTGAFFVAASFIFGSQLLSSDFWSIGSLSFTDMGTLLAHWQEYGSSLLETFPAMSVAGVLVPVFVFMLLLKQYAKEQGPGQLKFKSV